MPRSTQDPGAIPEDIKLLYENAIGNIEFAKRQQWWLTAQTLILYAGIFALFKSLDSPGPEEVWAAVFIALVAMLVSAYFLKDYSVWREGERARMDYIRRVHFSRAFDIAWREKGKHRRKTRWIDRWLEKHPKFSKYSDAATAMHGAIYLGGLVVIYAIVRTYCRAQPDFSLCWT